MHAIRKSMLLGAAVLAGLFGSAAEAQSETAFERIEIRAANRPLTSLARAAEASEGRAFQPGPPREVPNFRGKGAPVAGGDLAGPDPALQNSVGTGDASLGAGTVGNGFDGASNYADNGSINGYIVTPPDTDGQIGGANGQYFVQMVNSLTSIFDRNGNRLVPSFASNAFWNGIGGNCEPNNQGDPIVLYDEVANRWLVSQFAFPDSFGSFSQCVAISQTDDPRGAYHRYEFSFDSIGFNDYPKHGIVSDSITLMANIFKKRGRSFSYGGTFLGVMNKAAMYAGNPASLIGFNIGTGEFGFVAADRDGPGDVPALFATAMSSANAFDIWQINVNWSTGQASVGQIAAVPISPFDSVLCSASRGACIPQPDGGPALESLSDRLMHRLQVRDFGGYQAMLAAHTVDATGNGVAGIRWYEFRKPDGGNWARHQEGTYAPADGQYRWMPSIAMNETGDIGVGFLLGGPNTYMSVAVTGQSAAASGSGEFDAAELVCVHGSGVHEDAGRSGDYSSTTIDPADGTTFWHTNEYVAVSDQYSWNTYVCPFTIGDGSGGGNVPPTAVIAAPDCTDLACSFDGSDSSDSDGSIASYAWNFGDGGTASGATAAHTYGANGSYTVSLTVTDNEGATDTATTQVTVDDGVNAPPNAVITSISCSGLSCSYSGSGSSDSDGSITGYAWDFGDGGTATGVTANHSYAATGNYTVTLTVTDNGGATDDASQNITVNEPSAATSLAVASITVQAVDLGGGNKRPRALVTIRDDQGNAVSGATVTGNFSGDVSQTGATGTTGADGVATVDSTASRKGRLKFTFCVTDVDGSLTYVPGDNAQTCASL
jgi:PKD repeat protein